MGWAFGCGEEEDVSGRREEKTGRRRCVEWRRKVGGGVRIIDSQARW